MAPERRGGVAERPNPGRGVGAGHDARRGAGRSFRAQASRGLVHAACARRAAGRAGGASPRSPTDAGRLRVLDPACGDGRLLAAAAAALGPEVDVELVGIEVDVATAAAARRAVPGARILVGDGRTLDPGGLFDVVVGNPPYLGQLARATSRGGRSALGGGPYADVAAEFLARSLGARPTGRRPGRARPAAVRPVVRATRDPSGPRSGRARAVVGFWWSPTPVFDAAVTRVRARRAGRPAPGRDPPLVRSAVHRAGRRPGHGRRRPQLVAARGRPRRRAVVARARLRRPRGRPRLGHRRVPPAVLRPRAVRQRRRPTDRPSSPPASSTPVGARGVSGRPASPAARSPRRASTSGRSPRPIPASPRGSTGQRAPKVLVATQTKVIEAVVDPRGDLIPSVPVIAVHPLRLEDLWAVAAVLLAPPVAAWAATHHLGAGMGAGTLKLSARQVLGAAAAVTRLGRCDGAPGGRRPRRCCRRDVPRVRSAQGRRGTHPRLVAGPDRADGCLGVR